MEELNSLRKKEPKEGQSNRTTFNLMENQPPFFAFKVIFPLVLILVLIPNP